jgi:hypothetical protein
MTRIKKDRLNPGVESAKSLFFGVDPGEGGSIAGIADIGKSRLTTKDAKERKEIG